MKFHKFPVHFHCFGSTAGGNDDGRTKWLRSSDTWPVVIPVDWAQNNLQTQELHSGGIMLTPGCVGDSVGYEVCLKQSRETRWSSAGSLWRQRPPDDVRSGRWPPGVSGRRLFRSLDLDFATSWPWRDAPELRPKPNGMLTTTNKNCTMKINSAY